MKFGYDADVNNVWFIFINKRFIQVLQWQQSMLKVDTHILSMLLQQGQKVW